MSACSGVRSTGATPVPAATGSRAEVPHPALKIADAMNKGTRERPVLIVLSKAQKSSE
jgi:hypothetical protein